MRPRHWILISGDKAGYNVKNIRPIDAAIIRLADSTRNIGEISLYFQDPASISKSIYAMIQRELVDFNRA
jgi:hypothetical protein